MYPEHEFPVIVAGTMCRIIHVITACIVVIRTEAMQAANTELQKFLFDFHWSVRFDIAWRLTRENAVDGATCVVFVLGHASRGLIVRGDDDGEVFEVALVDHGFTEFYKLTDLRVPHPRAVEKPPLSLEIAIRGLNEHEERFEGAAEVLWEMVSREELVMAMEIFEGEPPSVLMMTAVVPIDLAIAIAIQIGLWRVAIEIDRQDMTDSGYESDGAENVVVADGEQW